MSTSKQSTDGVMRVRDRKKALRTEMRAVRDAVDQQTREELSAAACAAFLTSVPYHFAKSLLLYAPHGSEPDVFPLFDAAIRDGKAVFFPKCEGRGVMRFYRVKSRDELTSGKFGIPTPDGTSDEYLPENGEQTDVCVVPGVCFDTLGYRIGYGGGYYDRYLGAFHGIAAALTFDALIKKDAELPREKRYDKRVDVLYTEREVTVLGI